MSLAFTALRIYVAEAARRREGPPA